MSGQAERLDIEERYSSLQEEAVGKTKKLRKVWQLLLEARCELEDLRSEQQREKEGLLENVRQLTSDLRLQQLLIDQVRSRAIDQVRLTGHRPGQVIDEVRPHIIDLSSGHRAAAGQVALRPAHGAYRKGQTCG